MWVSVLSGDSLVLWTLCIWFVPPGSVCATLSTLYTWCLSEMCLLFVFCFSLCSWNIFSIRQWLYSYPVHRFVFMAIAASMTQCFVAWCLSWLLFFGLCPTELEVPTGNCSEGYYCLAGSPTATPVGSAYGGYFFSWLLWFFMGVGFPSCCSWWWWLFPYMWGHWKEVQRIIPSLWFCFL